MVAERLNCSRRTVESHRLMINRKLSKDGFKRLMALVNHYSLHFERLSLPPLTHLDLNELAAKAARSAPQTLF